MGKKRKGKASAKSATGKTVGTKKKESESIQQKSSGHKTGWRRMDVPSLKTRSLDMGGFMGLEVIDDYDTDAKGGLSIPMNSIDDDGNIVDFESIWMEDGGEIPGGDPGDLPEDLPSDIDELEAAAEAEMKSLNKKKEKQMQKKKKKEPSFEEERVEDGGALVSEQDNEEAATGGSEEGRTEGQDDKDGMEDGTNTDWATLGVHPTVSQALNKAGYISPTPVQYRAIPHGLQIGNDVLVAAETGSGKTLSFGIPLLHHLISAREAGVLPKPMPQKQTNVKKKREDEGDTADNDDADSASENQEKKKLVGLVIAPTRELALQVRDHLVAVTSRLPDKERVTVAAMVGGQAIPKQERLLKQRPEIIVGTPGRLHELMVTRMVHLDDLSGLKFLIIDEADRMIEEGHYQELDLIVQMALGSDRDLSMELPDAIPDDEDFFTGKLKPTDGLNAADNDVAKGFGAKSRKQVYVLSATLGLDLTKMRKEKKLAAAVKKKKRPGAKMDEEKGTVAMLLTRIRFTGKPKYVDLTTAKATAAGLTEEKIVCMQDEKDLYLYYILRNAPGKTLVFANSITCIQRLQSICRLLQLSKPDTHLQTGKFSRGKAQTKQQHVSDQIVVPVHGSMQQRARLKNLDRFKTSPRGVMLATDVAARGIDIRGITTVVHYQLPRTADTYIHRSGRTARGTDATGTAIALVSPDDSKNYKALLQQLKRTHVPPHDVDLTELARLRPVVKLVQRVDSLQHRQNKNARQDRMVRNLVDALGEDGGDAEDLDTEGALSVTKELSPEEKRNLAQAEAQLAQALAKLKGGDRQQVQRQRQSGRGKALMDGAAVARASPGSAAMGTLGAGSFSGPPQASAAAAAAMGGGPVVFRERLKRRDPAQGGRFGRGNSGKRRRRR
eukprot:Clim_evm29s202 gene=Clim_evmTU29s202